MTKEIVCADTAVPPLTTFSHAVKSNGFVYVSGSIGCHHDHLVVEGGIQEQTRAALNNMRRILDAAGCSLDNVVKVTVYLVHMSRDFDAMNDVYVQFFTPGEMPARTCIGVAALPMGAFIEVDCVAELPS